MKVLSNRAPFWWAIQHAGCRIVNRNWTLGVYANDAKYRGPILLHASTNAGSRHAFSVAADRILDVLQALDPVENADEPAAWERFRDEHLDLVPVVKDGRAHDAYWVPRRSLLPGGIVGRARLDGVIRTAADFAKYAASVAGGEEQRVWWDGGLGLVLADVEPLPFVRCQGRMGLFDVDDALVEEAACAR